MVLRITSYFSAYNSCCNRHSYSALVSLTAPRKSAGGIVQESCGSERLVRDRLAKVILKHTALLIARSANHDVPQRMSCFRLGTPPPIPTIRPILTFGKLCSICSAALATSALPHRARQLSLPCAYQLCLMCRCCCHLRHIFGSVVLFVKKCLGGHVRCVLRQESESHVRYSGTGDVG
jgi:hypothetical protein